MMMIFDPSNSMMNMGVYLTMLLPALIMLYTNKKMKKLSIFLMSEFMKNSHIKKKIMSKMISSMFFLYFILNLTNIIPYSFISTSHIPTNLSLMIMVCLSILMFNTINFFKNFLIKLTPPSTPHFIMPFMVIIELISYLIRPMTLTLRLTANMISGHILMFLAALMMKNLWFFFPMMMMLSFLELSMTFLQAYILFTLLSLYFNELS